MKFIAYFFILFQLFFVYGQEINTSFIKDYSLNADKFIGVDDFDNTFYIQNNILYKNTSQGTYTYANTQLGEISSVDITNPLKILVFFRDFNTVLLLDNRLNELTKPINFTTESFSKNIAFASMSSGNNLWLYSFDDNILQLWNHQTRKINFTSQPLTFFNGFEPIKQLSTYESCRLIGKSLMLKFNEYGTFIESYDINNSTIALFKEGYIILNENTLIYHDSFNKTRLININQEVFIKSFYINTNHIYIFDGTKIFIFKLSKFE